MAEPGEELYNKIIGNQELILACIQEAPDFVELLKARSEPKQDVTTNDVYILMKNQYKTNFKSFMKIGKQLSLLQAKK
jgi:hypothetical protein